MAIAPQNIMSKLRGMNDQQLAQYAQMHQQDPYIFPLAFQESQNRQHMRAAGQAQMAGQQQPKVVEQDLQQMLPQELPEDVGIAQLPADNMKSMAGGGIIAFEEGGEVPRFANAGIVYAPSSYGNTGNYQMPTEEELAEYNRKKQLGIWDSFKEYLPTDAPQLEPKVVRQRTVPNEPKPFTVTSTEPTGNIMGSRRTPEQLAKELPAGTEKITQRTPAMPGADVGLAGLAAGKAGSKSSLFQKEEQPTKEDYNKEYDTLYKALDEKNAKFLEGQKAKLKTDREESLYMAMIKGGLAAAAGTSQYGLTNLAKGFGEGAEDFSGSLKEFRKAAQETAKAELEMERAQADRKAGRLDKYDARMEKAKDRQLEADKAILSANTTLQHAGITAGATLKAAQLPPKEAQMAALLGEGKTFEERFQSGLPKLTAIQAGKFDPRKAYTEYLVAAQRSGTGDVMSFPEFAMQFGPRVSGGGAGTVLPRKD